MTMLNLLFTCFVLTSALEIPKGVSNKNSHFYIPSEYFSCLDSSMIISFDQVNDDYCDCLDGTDEPGTPACPNGVFHCLNEGFESAEIPSTRVNDGVCDCCDGSDEYDMRRVNCSNWCNQLGLEAAAEIERITELRKKGANVRAQLASRAVSHIEEMNQQLNILRDEKAQADKLVEQLRKIKNDVEASERSALQKYAQGDKKGNVDHLSIEEEIKLLFNECDSNGDSLLTNAEIITCASFDDIDITRSTAEDIARLSSDSESEITIDFFADKIYPLMKSTRSSRPSEDDEAEYDDETKAIVRTADASRKRLADAERTARDITNNLNSITIFLEKEFGPEEVFATMDGKCYEFADLEYVYKLCLFNRVTQRAKLGGEEVILGVWGEWPSAQDNNFDVMLYNMGAPCWKGPDRSARVQLICDLENKITSITEPSRCEYSIVFHTPAACEDDNEYRDTTHDEL